ncbi:asparagine synthase-related protein [Actinomadura rupiterrae]|uniref:asparagine synthase-related protein n=1 Tax=Actinomadura rupiterrae TaxID=559627 RepID=UPI0020A2A34F|nr:asparagine synthase-related protein [Actinomadura rupiterrae]MCP2343813.1 asparagine synthase (glutamine-hydrolyzing) [Actinomadura rupiterrae]
MRFIVLPDRPVGPAASALAAGGSAPPLRHPSGRLWIAGDWSPAEIRYAALGSRAAVLFGPSTATVRSLKRMLARARTPAEVASAARAFGGCFHLAVSMDGSSWVQGSLSSARQVFHARVAGAVVASDRPEPLVRALGATVRDELLAVRMIAPWTPWPLSEESLWHGVESLPAGRALEVDPDGRGRVVRWWRPPEPRLSLPETAALVREALRDGVRARVRDADVVSADLSGGMDSTSLCFLAAKHTGRLVTSRMEANDRADEDGTWADRAAGMLPGEHLVFRRGTTPAWFTGVLDHTDDLEEPYAWIRTRAALLATAQRVAARGSSVHLTGHGGDELFLAKPVHLRELARRRPLAAVRHLRAYRALYRWPMGPMLRGLKEDASFGEWLAASAGALAAKPGSAASAPAFGWGLGGIMPPWATPDAVEAARAVLRDAAGRTLPLSPERGQHSLIQDVRGCGATIRHAARITGMPWEAPYLDDRVVDAALSLRYEERVDLTRYKPVLSHALRGLVPPEFLGRTTKSEYGAEAYRGLRENRDDLLSLCEDSYLARQGLVDVHDLRRALTVPPPTALGFVPLVSTVACEVWARSLAVRAGGVRTSEGELA